MEICVNASLGFPHCISINSSEFIYYIMRRLLQRNFYYYYKYYYTLHYIFHYEYCVILKVVQALLYIYIRFHKTTLAVP